MFRGMAGLASHKSASGVDLGAFDASKSTPRCSPNRPTSDATVTILYCVRPTSSFWFISVHNLYANLLILQYLLANDGLLG